MSTIFLSAGHYPQAPGAVYEGFVEHDEAMLWARRIVEFLGADAVLVPTGFLKDKVAFINARQVPGSVCVEIHFNDAVRWRDKNADGKVTPDELEHVGEGAETLYCPGSGPGALLAAAVQDAIDHLFPYKWTDHNRNGVQEKDELTGRGVKEGWYRMDKAKGPDFILAKTACPTVIVEPEFVQRKDRIIANREAACVSLATALRAFVQA